MKTKSERSGYVEQMREKYFKPEYEHVPLMLIGSAICVYRINTFNEVEILLQKRRDTNNYGLPGGSFETDETNPKESAVRELFEETNIKVSSPDSLKLFDIYINIKSEYPNGDQVLCSIVAYTIPVDSCSVNIFTKNSESIELIWATSLQAEELDIFMPNVQLVKDLFNHLK